MTSNFAKSNQNQKIYEKKPLTNSTFSFADTFHLFNIWNVS